MHSQTELEHVVEQFLQLALVHPKKAPKTQRVNRENQAMIIGYNRAQEDLRSLLEMHGMTDLGATRVEGQQQPIDMNGHKTWQMS